MDNLVRCGYGEEGSREDCCLRGDGNLQAWHRCPVFDWEPCPYGKRVEGCGTCANCDGMSEDDGARTVSCAENPRQMFQPYATECVRWEKSLG
jgi:hypothetical protein